MSKSELPTHYLVPIIVYEPDYQTSENGNFIDCSSGRTSDDIERVCEFKLDAIRPCVKEDDFGFGDGQPCIILKLNKVCRIKSHAMCVY